MASNVALLFALNILFFTLVSSNNVPACPTTPNKPPKLSSPAHKSPATCPKNTLKFGVCANVLKNLLKIELGKPPKKPCCSLVKDLVDLEAAVCLCTALKADVLGTKLKVPLSLTLLLNYCGKKVPSGFQCD